MQSRLRFALDRAEQSADVGSWLGLAFSLYERTAGSDADAAELRNEIRTRAERLRTTYRSRSGRLWAAQSLDPLLGRLLSDELEPGPLDDQTFDHIESLKARTLLEAMDDPVRGAGARGLGTAASEAERELLRFEPPDPEFADVLHEEMRLASMLPIGIHWDAGQRAQQLHAIEAEYERLGIERPPPARPAKLGETKAALAGDEAIVEYVIPKIPLHPAADLWACVIRRDAAELVHLADFRDTNAGFIGAFAVDGRAPIDMSPLGEAVVSARTAIREPDDAAAAPYLAWLGASIFEPIESAGLLAGVRRVVVIPSGVLHYVPFAALPTGDGNPLGARVAITLAPSATTWLRAVGRLRPQPKAFLGLGNPSLDYRPDLPSLPQAEEELSRISSRLAGVTSSVHVAVDATEQVLHQESGGAGVVHIATHGDFPEENALDMQRVLLAPGPGHDGPLHAEEIRALDLRSTRLLALSVCNGGLYRFGPGDEPYGMVPAALIAGAENVLGTLWAIDDRIGRSFMTRLYKDLLAAGPAAALQATAAEFREDGAHIREWAGFVNVGAGRPLSAN